MSRKPKSPKKIETLKHAAATRKNIPTAELQSAVQRMEETVPTPPVRYPRDPDLDPQLCWRGKDTQNWTDLVVDAPPLYIQEKIHPKAIIDGLLRESAKPAQDDDTPDLFADFNGLEPEARTEFYEHDQHWSNRMILGDSLQVMASLAEREALRGKVQCIYFDPPYGIKFSSNWQPSTRSRDVKDGKREHITREPEQIKAFRDTWGDGVHSYLTYLRDRLTVMHDMLTESGSIFVQIGDENVHRVRCLMDEVFGEGNFVSIIPFRTKTRSLGGQIVEGMLDFILYYAKCKDKLKFRTIYEQKDIEGDSNWKWFENSSGERKKLTKQERENHSVIDEIGRVFRTVDLRPAGFNENQTFNYIYKNKEFPPPGNSSWLTNEKGLDRLNKSDRLQQTGKNNLERIYYYKDYPIQPLNNLWSQTRASTDKVYVVQTSDEIIKRCILMATDPGDLVLDPTCGAGTTAAVAEQWGRRWITIDTSRVALALARTRLMGARYPYYLLADTPEGQKKEAQVTGKPPADTPTQGDVRLGFVYERAPHITLKSIANNEEIDGIWEGHQEVLEPLRATLNAALGQKWEAWDIPREAGADWPKAAQESHAKWWEQRIARQREIDASIARRAAVEMLYDRPYQDKSRVRVAGPFTVESLSPHWVAAPGEDELLEGSAPRVARGEEADFAPMVLEHLRSAGVQGAAKADRIAFTALEPWPGERITAIGTFMEEETPRRAGVFVGPQYGTVSRPDLMDAAREALDARLDILVACGFNFEAHAADVGKLGPLPIIKAKMNPELHMGGMLKNTGAGNLFVAFGEPDIRWEQDATGQIVVRFLGVDVYDPKAGGVRSTGTEEIAAWFIDTDYNAESFFVRHAYFVGADDPYKALKRALKADVDADAWGAVHRDTSRPFSPPASGRFAVKAINHFWDEVVKVFGV